jgi:hypothetical protein
MMSATAFSASMSGVRHAASRATRSLMVDHWAVPTSSMGGYARPRRSRFQDLHLIAAVRIARISVARRRAEEPEQRRDQIPHQAPRLSPGETSRRIMADRPDMNSAVHPATTAGGTS